MMISDNHYFDVCIVCALAEEAQAVLKVISRRCRVVFKKGFSASHNYEYRYTTIQNNKGEPITIHVSWLPDKGPLEMALHFKPILEEFRPRFVAMTGICAGDKRKVKLGDLVIADRAFLSDIGKVVTDEDGQSVHLHNVKTYNADPSILQTARLFDAWRPVVAKLRRPPSLRQQREWLLSKLLEEAIPQVEKIPLEEREKQAPHWRRIVQELDAYLTKEWALKDTSRVHQLRYGKDIFPFKDPRRPESYIAPMASGNAVRSDNPFKEVQLPVREAIAIDMEGAAFYRTLEEFPHVRSLLIKGVCDYADKEKDDTYHHYASVVSAVYVLCFIQEYVTEERMPKSQGRPTPNRGSSPPSATTGRSPRASPLIEELSDNYVYRVHEFEALKASILHEGQHRLTAITSALKGAGGYGKTTLAQALCHDSEIIAAFPDGIEWITLGEAPTTSDLVDKMKGVIYRLRQTSLLVESIEVARAELRAALEDHSLLLILDDVWRTPDLKPFLEGGPRCASLITTRNEGVLPLDIPCISVDAMSPEESVQLLYAELGTPEEFQRHEKTFYELARRLKEWPLLLALANGILHNRIKRHHQAIADALTYLNHALDKRGLVAFDPSQPQERHQAIGLTLEVSFALLSNEEYTRYLKLAIFPENISLPFDVIHRLWRTVAELEELDTEEICLKLYELSLLRSCDLIRRQTQLHDVIRGYLRIKMGNALSLFQQQFLNTYSITRWADLPADEGYLWKYLIPHLIESGQLHRLHSTVTDLRYLAKKVYVQHSAYAAEADIELAETILSPSILPELSSSPLNILRFHLAKFGDLLHACKTLQEVESTLLAYVYHLQEFLDASRAFQQEIARPFLIPWHPLPDTRDTTLIRTLHGHTGPVTDCAVNADGTWIVSASADTTLKLWDVHTGALRFTLEGHAAPVTSCAITPRGNRIISASDDGTIKVWNAYTGNELLSLSRYTSPVTRCAMSPDGNWFVSASEDTTLKVWDIRTVNAFPPLQRYHVSVIRTLRGHKGAVRSCAISPDGTWIASVSDDWTLRLWDARTGTQLSVVEVEMEEDALDDTIYDCAIGPDGTWLTFTYSLGLRVWDVATSTERFTTFAHVGIVIGCATSPDGRWMLSTSRDGTLKGWRADADTDIFILKGHVDSVNRCAISPHGDWVVSASDDHTLKLWQVPPISQERLPDEEEYAFGLVGCAISHTGAWAVSVSLNGNLKRWNVDKGTEQEILSLNVGVGSYATCAISPDDTWIVTGSDERTLKTWDTRTGNQLLTFSGHTGAINDCAISPNGTWVVSASDDQTLKTWNARTGADLLTLPGHTGAVNGCAISSDGTWIVSAADDQTLKTWNVQTGNLLHTFSGHTGSVHDCVITPSGDHIVSASDDGTVRIWNANNPTESPVKLQHASAVQCCAMSPDGCMIVSLVGTQVKLWDVATGTCLTTFYAHNAFSDCVFHLDGHHLIIAAENGLYFFHIQGDC